MGNVLVSLEDEQELLLRRIARQLYGHRKGALSAAVTDAIQALAKNDARHLSIEQQAALMRNGFDFGLAAGRAYEKRSDVYD